MDEKDPLQQPNAATPDTQVPMPDAATQPMAETQPAATTQPAAAPTEQPAAAAPPEQSATAAPAPDQPVTAGAAQGAPVQQQYATQPTATMQTPPVNADGQVPPQQPYYGAPSPDAPIAAPGQPGAPVPSPTGALVCGILAIVFCFIPIIGIVLGIVAIVLAGKYFKAGGTQGQGKAGRICGIIGLILAVLMLILNITIAIGALMFDSFDTPSRYTASSSATYSSSSASTTAGALEEAEADVSDVVAARLQEIEDRDPAAIAPIKAEMEATFEEGLAVNFDEDNLTMAACGVNVDDYVELMLEGFSYKPMYMMVDGAEEGDTAEANFYVTMRSMYDVVSELNDMMRDEYSDLMKMSQAERAQRIGAMLIEATTDTEIEEDELFDVDLTYEGGTWVIDEDTWDDEINYFFGFM